MKTEREIIIDNVLFHAFKEPSINQMSQINIDFLGQFQTPLKKSSINQMSQRKHGVTFGVFGFSLKEPIN